MKLHLLIFLYLILFPGIECFKASAQGQDKFIYMENGKLYHPDGSEVALWGVNLQSMLSWEYNALMKKAGIPKDAEVWKSMVDNALDELEIMNCKVWRTHLTPADFTDANGNLAETIYLDLLDYTIAEASKRGIYAYVSFINHMGNYEVEQSFMQKSFEHAKLISNEDKKHFQKALLMFDENYLNASKNYITNLLNRVNPYSNSSYNNDTSIVVWEIMNEPTYMSYDMMKLYDDEYNRYRSWLADSGYTENGGEYYPRYRKLRVLDYINEMYQTVKDGGAKQPIGWNCNWHRMIRGREDVFEAIAQSEMDVISFCNYPGQGVASKDGPYWSNPVDLTEYDFTNWYRECYDNRDWYGWALEPRFADKAKVVYEFETFYNQSAYLYPVMADFMRSMGVQAATMWHYSFSAYAHKRNGSHMLNLKCTPRKAASFVVASKIFENTPLLQPYHTSSTTEWTTDSYMYSYEKNLSIFSSTEEYITSGTLYRPESPMPHDNVKHIYGYGSSPVVKYCGSGTYDIHISSDTIKVHIEPNSGWLRPPWGRDGFRYIVTELDYDREYLMELRLKGWNVENCSLFRVNKENESPQSFIGNKLRFVAKPGDYIITKK